MEGISDFAMRQIRLEQEIAQDYKEQLETTQKELAKYKRLADYGLHLYMQARFVYGDDPVIVDKRVQAIKAKER